MGITFKENCPDIRNSKVVDLVFELQTWGAEVIIEDPWADKSEVENLYDLSLEKIDKNDKVDAIIVAVGHQEFRDLSPKYLRDLCKTDMPVLGDLKSIYKKEDAINAGFTVFRL